ncbi:substrate-binding domain-containing protein [Nordella sp. HKS 07]|uniref:LacI family DNA-binding transcriptional regulator n=1 Tax=Nordella sp. HKS 07 TaxID=2712222 RepID=UPI0013E12F45|nr:LacI family DNA-binding transcriptional regulator [Nordella sp. HKS 07]QIG51133.1 substrate-binding domain-containing protein [Nordella sp. HKS 07]
MNTRKPQSQAAGQRPTVKTLAQATGYSIATISKALRDSPVVTAETKERIREAALKVGYQANMRGVSLRAGRTFQAAVLMPVIVAEGFEWDGVEYTQILSGISQALEGSPYNIAVHVIRDADDGRIVAQRIVETGLADGLIFSGIRADDPRIDFLVERNFPFVALGRCRKPVTYAHVDVDNDWAAHAATQRLIAGGHQRIALINPDSRLSYALDRIDGFRRAFLQAGLAPCDDLMAMGGLSPRFGKESALRLGHLPDPPTGFICVNEATTLGVLAGLSELGLAAGRDVDVIAYDDINVSAYFSPPLTTFYLPIERLGRKLGEFFLRRIAGEEPAALQEIYQPDLVVRQANKLVRP